MGTKLRHTFYQCMYTINLATFGDMYVNFNNTEVSIYTIWLCFRQLDINCSSPLHGSPSSPLPSIPIWVHVRSIAKAI